MRLWAKDLDCRLRYDTAIERKKKLLVKKMLRSQLVTVRAKLGHLYLSLLVSLYLYLQCFQLIAAVQVFFCPPPPSILTHVRL